MPHNDGMTSEDIFDAHWTLKGKAAANYSFTDTRKLRGAGGKGFANARPSDRIVTFNGEMFFAEVKSTQNKTSFPYSNIEPSQMGWARRITAAGGLYFFFIHALVPNQWFRVPAEYVLTSDKRSANFKEIAHYEWHPEI